MTTVQQAGNPQPGYPPPSGYPQAAYPPQQQPLTIVQAPPQTNQANASTGYSRYNKKAGVVTGILQLFAATILILMGIVNVLLGSIYIIVGWSFWGSICFYGVTGILGIISRHQGKCVIIAYMVMCIISAVCAGGQMIWESVGAADTAVALGFCHNYRADFDYFIDDESNCRLYRTIQTMHAISAVVAAGELIIAIVASAYCCAGSCRGDTPTQTTVVTYGQPVPLGTQVTVLGPGSYIPGPPQTSYPQTSYPSASAQPPGYTEQPVPVNSAEYVEPK